ncbi:50S ribosomal protein L31e [candidate division KSB1 bacterium]
MALERTYTIPLRRFWLNAPKNKRAKRAVSAVKNFLARHMKQEDPSQIKIGSKLNHLLWEKGIKNPPGKVKVTVIKEDDGLVKVELFGHKYVVKKKVEKKEEEGGIAGKLKSALGKKDEPKKEEAEEEKKEESKKEEKHVKKEEKPKEEKKETKPAKK